MQRQYIRKGLPARSALECGSLLPLFPQGGTSVLAGPELAASKLAKGKRQPAAAGRTPKPAASILSAALPSGIP
jgi:hypothetical protein